MFFGGNVAWGIAPSSIDYAGLPYNNLKEKAGFVLKAGFDIVYHFNNKIALQSGVSGFLKTYRVAYPKDFTQIRVNLLQASSRTFNISIPLEVKYLIPISKKKKSFFISTLGMFIDFYPENQKWQEGGSAFDPLTNDVASYYADYGIKSIFSTSPKVSIGIEKITKKNNINSFSINFIWGLKQVMNGNFKYWDGYWTFPFTGNPNNPVLLPPIAPNEEYEYFSKGTMFYFEFKKLFKISK